MSTVTHIDNGRLLAGTGPIIKRDSFSATLRAEAAYTLAKQQAEALLARQQEACEAERRKAWEEGYEAGREAFAAQMTETAARIESAWLGLEGRIVGSVVDALERILGAMQPRERLVAMVRRTLAAVDHERPLKLRVAAAEVTLVNAEIEAILQDFPRVQLVEVLSDPDAEPGTCVLESAYGRIDGSLRTQLLAVRAGLVQAFVGRREQARPAREDSV
ncbi:type III secretion system stator protein SctL [Aquabacterium sp. A7-Y]|uniref:type III secretion system stator protein SctL n=1 Tax=Aquabacterium sp. A7-Y TaxID=1349605 RepID=UPI00223D0C78|nr:type III secretion system stator protein SctL [Aquabacterium sp. A7-Y]MCW7542112.1 type III secretion system stator protein SctL [Aquabacterium sp. A7-Y]